MCTQVPIMSHKLYSKVPKWGTKAITCMHDACYMLIILTYYQRYGHIYMLGVKKHASEFAHLKIHKIW